MWCLNYTFFSKKEVLSNVKDYLQGPKKENFTKYLNFLSSLPSQLEKKYEPFKYLKMMTSRTGLRVSFLDKNMSVIKASDHISFPHQFIAQPEKIIIGFDPVSQQFSFQAQGRWY